MGFPNTVKNHLGDNAIVPVDSTPWLQAASHRLGLRLQQITHVN